MGRGKYLLSAARPSSIVLVTALAAILPFYCFAAEIFFCPERRGPTLEKRRRILPFCGFQLWFELCVLTVNPNHCADEIRTDPTFFLIVFLGKGLAVEEAGERGFLSPPPPPLLFPFSIAPHWHSCELPPSPSSLRTTVPKSHAPTKEALFPPCPRGAPLLFLPDIAVIFSLRPLQYSSRGGRKRRSFLRSPFSFSLSLQKCTTVGGFAKNISSANKDTFFKRGERKRGIWR